jgi:hypothetical protein
MHDCEIRSSINPIDHFQHVTSSGLSSTDQLLERARGSANLEGERQMLQEILLDAIECWQSASTIVPMNEEYVTSLRERLYREANFWIFGDYSNAPYFSFTQLCDCLDLNPDFIRRLLLEWRHKQSAGR